MSIHDVRRARPPGSLVAALLPFDALFLAGVLSGALGLVDAKDLTAPRYRRV
jgi:hypothetical protein